MEGCNGRGLRKIIDKGVVWWEELANNKNGVS